MFPMRVLNVSKSVAKESLYLETGKLPLKYIIKMRRLLYHSHIVRLEEKKLLHRVYKAQCFGPPPQEVDCPCPLFLVSQ